MVETLVSIFLFSFGVLGLSKMQATTLLQIDDSKQHMVAAWKAQDLADRIRATRNAANTDGLADLYLATIAGDIATIGSDTAGQAYTCPANPPPDAELCASRRDGGALKGAQVCTDQQLVNYDVWETLCDPDTGLTTNMSDADGAVSLQELEIVMTAVDTVVPNPVPAGGGTKTTREYMLYMEWVSGTADGNVQIANAISTNLCGNAIDVDPKLGVFCLRFR